MKLKKRFLFLIVFTVAAVLFSALFMMNVGNKYSLLISADNLIYSDYEKYTYDEIEKFLADATVTFDDEKENIVKIDKISFDRSSKIVKFDISAIDKGEGCLNVSYKLNGKQNTYLIPLKVTYFNIIINKSLFDFSGSLAVEVVILLVLLVFTIITGYSFFEKIKLAEYSYDMILYGGVSLFCLHQFLYAMTTFFQYAQYYNGMCYFGLFASNLNNSVKMFCLLSIPVMFIMSIFVSVSNVSLIIHEGFRPLNMLGIILGVVWASSIILFYIFSNMQFSKKIISEDFKGGENPETAFSTTNYHVFRSYMLANKNQMKAKGMGCKTKFYFFPNAFLREFIGLLVEEKIIHITAFIIISVLYSFLGILEWI